MDYKKAFDLVWREALWYKMSKNGITGKVLDVIKSMYANIKSCVSLGGEQSDYFISLKGVRQGENLSPLLFSLFVNDLEESLVDKGGSFLNSDDEELNAALRILVLMYADDTVIFANGSTELEQAIDSLQTYCEEWKLQVNCSKTKIMILGRGKNTCREEFYMHNEKIERVEEYKYLGLWFNHRGDFKKAQAELLKQASRAMYSLVSKSRKLDLPVDLQIELFHSLVVPIVTYGSEIWGFSMCSNIEKLHLKFLKLIMGVRASTCSAAVYGETGTFPLYVGVYTRMIGFWCRTLQGKSNKLSHKLLKLMYTLHENGLYEWPWLQHVKKVLDNCGLSNIWRSQASEENAKWLKTS